MNNIFKVIWNHATQTWTAVGELASAKGKSKSVKLAAISTALLAVAGGVFAAEVAQTPSTPVDGTVGEEVEVAASQRGGLAIATNKVTNQFFGNDRYKAETGLSKNVLGATVNAYDGIAIGNGAVSGGADSTTGGNAHVAIGLMAHASAGGANGQNAAVALGAYSLATGQGGTAIGAHSIADALNSTALGKVAKANGDGSTAVGTNTRAEWQGTALGNTAEALANYATSIGVNSKANSHSSISIGRQAVVSGQNAIGMGTQTQVNGDGTVAVGSSTNVSSKNVSTLGSNINVGSGRDGAVVLGHGSDAGGDSVVTAVNSATAAGSPLIYKGFAGNLGDKSKDATNSEASNQGRIVSVGDDTKKIQVTTEVSNGTKTTTTVIKNLITKEVTEIVETSTIKDGKDTITKVVNDITDPNNKKVKVPSKTEVKDTKAQPHQDSAKQVGPEQTIYGERQIQHVAAGEITAGSTNAINGSQLYQVAKTLGTAAKGLADTLGVELTEDGEVKTPFKHKLNIIDGSTYPETDPATNVTEALNNLNSYVNAGWTVAAAGNGYEKHVSIGHTVNFVGLGNVDVDGVDEENGVRTINISSDSPIDYATTKAEVDGKEVDVVKANDGKWYPKDKVDEDNNPKEGAVSIPSSDIVKKGAKLTDSDTENNPYEKGNAYTYDKDGNITATGYDKTKPESKDEITAGKNGVQLNNVGWATQPDQAVNKDQLDQTVNKSGFFVKNNGNDVATKDSTDKEISPKDKVTPNDAINFANGDGTVVNVKTVRDENGVDTTTVSVDVDAAKVIEKTKGSIKVAETDPKSANAGKVTVTPVQKPDGSMETQEEANARDGNKLATVGNVVEAINSAKWFAKVENTDTAITDRTQNDTTDKNAEAIGAGETLTLKADKNLAVKRDGANVTYGLASEIEVDKITVKSKTPGEATTTFENGKVTNLKDHLTPPKEVAADKAAVPNAEEVKTPELTADNKKEAATVNDVLNAGWNLKANGKQVAAVTNGKGVDFESDGSITITPTVENGIAKMKFAVNTDASIDKNKGSIKEADVSNPGAKDAGKVAVNGTPAQKADGSMETQDEANAREGNKVATVQNVVNAINSAATFVKVADSQEVITASTANDKGVAVKSGDTVTHTAGKNLKVKRDGQSVTYALAQDIDVDSVKAKNGVTIGSGDNATTITSDDKGLNLAGKNGVATNINNVKDADLNSTSKQAVNGSQLHATNEKVASLGTTVNNLDRKVNKHSKQARAGIAGANAAAALPQAYTQGKAMVAAAAGTFKGQNALAVGYSRISDNGKVILKLQGNANTSGDVGAGVGVGYQW